MFYTSYSYLSNYLIFSGGPTGWLTGVVTHFLSLTARMVVDAGGEGVHHATVINNNTETTHG